MAGVAMSHIEFFILLAVLLWLMIRIPPPSVIAANLDGMQKQFDLLNQRLDAILEKQSQILEAIERPAEHKTRATP